MNFQIQQTYPSPNTGLNEHNKLTYAQHINSLVLYGQQKLEANAQGEQPKKKIAFKASKAPQLPTTDKISVYSLGDRKWNIIQAKGKIPASRTQFESIYMNPCMIIYGGKINGKNLNEVFALNCSTWTWKKLFSLDGPTAGEYLKFFKISNTTAGLINSSSLWLLYVADVKWQLSSNELPGSVWQKINVNLPQNIKFCWPINQQKLLIIGEKKSICINLQTKQSISQFSSNFLVRFSNKNEIKIKDCYPIQTLDSNQSKYCLVATQQFIYGLKYLKTPKQSIEVFNWRNQQYIQLNRQIKCCAIVEQKNLINKQIFYVDIKGQLISVRFQFKEQVQNFNIQRTNSQIINNTTSCIEQQQNESSSVLVPSNNSRVHIERNQNNHNNDIYQPEDQLINSRLTQKQRDSNYRQNLKPTKQNYSQRISDESDQQRQINYTKQTNILLKQQQYRKKHMHLQMNSMERNYNQHFKYKTQEHIGVKQQKKLPQHSLEQEGHHNMQANMLKQKLSHILYNQTIKRKLLQNKVQALQSIIKKSQKFVLMLCKYGNKNQKQKHIEKVKKIRQQLQWNWSKQIYYRKQMQQNKLPNQLSQQIHQTMSHIQF